MKVGVVGHGSIGKRHANNLRTLGHKVLIFDPLGAKDVKFEREIYDECEAVVIATPSIYHQGGIRACVEHGKHMLIEKPIAMDDRGIADLLRIADEKKLVVMMGNNLRYHPCVIQAKEWIKRWEIGQSIWAHFICAQKASPQAINDGVVMNTGSHEVEMALHLLGPAEVIHADATNLRADFTLKHGTGCRSTFHIDFLTESSIRESWIVGERGRIGIELLGRSTILNDQSQRYDGSYDDDYMDEMKDFIDAVGGHPFPRGASGWDGLRTIELLIAVEKMAGLR